MKKWTVHVKDRDTVKEVQCPNCGEMMTLLIHVYCMCENCRDYVYAQYGHPFEPFHINSEG